MDVSPQYDVGTPALVDLWVDPLHGDDARSGASRADALRTVAEGAIHLTRAFLTIYSPTRCTARSRSRC